MTFLKRAEIRAIEEAMSYPRGFGYVLDFSDGTMREFFEEEFGVDIYSPEYPSDGTSKRHHLIGFLKTVDTSMALRVLRALSERREGLFQSAASSSDVRDAGAKSIALGKLIQRLEADERSPTRDNRSKVTGGSGFDVFISHASEDKEAVARPLRDGLAARGITVWFDEAELTLGDSLRSKIDDGLLRSRYGIVVLSPDFFRKEWPQRELDGLVARETTTGEKAILPVWHNLDVHAVARYSPSLAGRLAANSRHGIANIVKQVLRVLAPDRESS
jgi:hypothetical protein